MPIPNTTMELAVESTVTAGDEPRRAGRRMTRSMTRAAGIVLESVAPFSAAGLHDHFDGDETFEREDYDSSDEDSGDDSFLDDGD